MTDKLIEAMGNLEADAVYEYVKEYILNGKSKETVLELLNEGQKIVGKKYESGIYFLADLIYSGMIYTNVIEMDVMQEKIAEDSLNVGRVLVGTVAGDVHDIAKSILISSLQANGFTVFDAGVDVTPEKYVNAVKKFTPDVLCISGLMSFSVEEVKNTIEALKDEGLRDSVKIIVGGNDILNELAKSLGADAYGQTVTDGLKLCLKFVKPNC